MARTETLAVRGLRELNRDLRSAEKSTRKQVREAEKKAGVPVRDEWRRTLTPVHAYSASKLRIRATQNGVFVDQPLRKTTGQHPEFGALQMRQGVAALERKRGEVERVMAEAVDEIADIVDRGPVP